MQNNSNHIGQTSIKTAATPPPIDPNTFRHVLGHYPTGVCVVTAMDDEGQAGMVIGSFTSASLDPPLIAFFPDKSSTSWPRIERVGRYCINILSADQLSLCKRFASRGGDKFAGLAHKTTPSGAAVLDGVVAWLDCVEYATQEAGDHYLALGRVVKMEVVEADNPMLFFKGGYGAFSAMEQNEG